VGPDEVSSKSKVSPSSFGPVLVKSQRGFEQVLVKFKASFEQILVGFRSGKYWAGLE
jgi:hypothetical protein